MDGAKARYDGIPGDITRTSFSSGSADGYGAFLEKVA